MRIMLFVIQRLIQELDSREAQFVAVVDKGEALVMDRHPASKTIEVSLLGPNLSSVYVSLIHY